MPAIFWLSWICILLPKLKGIDGRDDVTKLSYIAAVTAFGCVLLIALPTLWGRFRTPLESVLMAGFFVVAGYIRWTLASVPSGVQTASAKTKADAKGM